MTNYFRRGWKSVYGDCNIGSRMQRGDDGFDERCGDGHRVKDPTICK